MNEGIRILKLKHTYSGVNASLTLGDDDLPLPFFPSPPHLTPSPPSLPLPLEVGPLNPARGSGGALLAPPAGSGTSRNPKIENSEIEFGAF